MEHVPVSFRHKFSRDIVDRLDKRRVIAFVPKEKVIDFAGLLLCLRTKLMRNTFDLVYNTWLDMNQELGIENDISHYKKWKFGA